MPRKPSSKPKPVDLGVSGTKLKGKTKPTVEQQAAAVAQTVAAEAAAIVELETKKAKFSELLKDVERQIYELESNYLNLANPQGNALKGYAGLLSAKLPNKKTSKQEDRIFSGSSVTGLDHLPK